ncbi:flavocytochrome c [Sinomonas cyclohexanicum]|uniref:Flavocytochrome c n=1 Tax=Sinomonas cyclohexanicum TaxID=322009 RepID=A0ABM7PSN5_SINCY|nr:FAD-dependent oxidoreductase [Corynebacterium cyclohexanicum]BCT75241.1 flavocytochrome c [Corynebacterium cyclohexanicum]
MNETEQAFDVVVLGSGMSGLSAGWTAAQSGARVAVLEKLTEIGGSAALSAGMFWTAPDFGAYQARVPLGDRVLGRRLVDDYEAALAEIRGTGIDVAAEPLTGIMTFGRGYSLAIRDLLPRLAVDIVAAGGRVATSARATEIRRTPDGFHLTVETDDGALHFACASLVLATGGFAGSAEKLGSAIGRNADRLVHRANKGSVGDGLDHAKALGAAASRGMSTFYGHLLPSPLASFEPEEFLPLSQYYSDYCILVNTAGRRFIDERQGDELLNQELVFQPEARGFLIFDDRVRTEHATAEPFPGLGVLDRYKGAVAAGARHVQADTLEGLLDAVSRWGLPRDTLARTVEEFSRATAAGGGHAGGAAVSPAATAPAVPPFYALEVQPSVTFTFGGIRIDSDGRALDADGRAVPGLFAAGADAGGLSNIGYAGGLAPAYITGRWAGAAAAAHAALGTDSALLDAVAP